LNIIRLFRVSVVLVRENGNAPVRCTKGAIYVIIDLRPNSSTFKQWLVVELMADNRQMRYIPERFAHGFQTLEDNGKVFYQMSECYPKCARGRGVWWDDPTFKIK